MSPIHVRIEYDGGQIRVEIQESSTLAFLLHTVISRAPHYTGGSLQLIHDPHRNLNLEQLAVDVLKHGDAIRARTVTQSSEKTVIVPPKNNIIDNNSLNTESLENNIENEIHSEYVNTQQIGLRRRRREPQTTENVTALRVDEIKSEEKDSCETNSLMTDAGIEPALCRICHSGYEMCEELGQLFSPCLCSGTVRHVHVECLNEWRRLSVNPRSYYECDQCKYRYLLRRTAWATILMSPLFITSFSVALVFVAVILIAFPLTFIVPHFVHFDFAKYMYRVRGTVPPWRVWRSWRWLSSLLDFIFAGVSGLGVCGFCLYLYHEYLRHRNDNDAVQQFIWQGLRFLSLSHYHLARVSVAIGIAIAFREVFGRIKLMCSVWSQKYGEQILHVSNSNRTDT